MAKRRSKKGPQPTSSRRKALDEILSTRTPAEIGALFSGAMLLSVFPEIFRSAIGLLAWLRDARSRLIRVEELPPLVEKLLASGVAPNGSGSDVAAAFGPEMTQHVIDAMRFASSVRDARRLLPSVGKLIRSVPKESRLSGFVKMPALDLTAVVMAYAERAGFSRRFSATEAMAFATLIGQEQPTDDAEQRRNTWSKRLMRIRKKVDASFIDFARQFFRVYGSKIEDRETLERILSHQQEI